jgi:hypothetical protein
MFTRTLSTALFCGSSIIEVMQISLHHRLLMVDIYLGIEVWHFCTSSMRFLLEESEDASAIRSSGITASKIK